MYALWCFIVKYISLSLSALADILSSMKMRECSSVNQLSA